MEEKMYQEYLNQAQLLLSAEKYEDAIKYFEKAENDEPNHVEVYVGKGIALVNMDKVDDAEKTFKKALYVDKKCGEVYFHLACICGLKGDLTQAITYIDMAKANGYENAQLYFTLGMMFEEQDNVNMALRNYNKALMLEPVRADIQLQKCQLLINSNRREEALEGLDSMILNCPDYFEGYHLKCQILTEFERYDEANELLNQALKLFPEEVGFKLDKAKICIVQEKLDEAINELKVLEPNADEWKREVLLELARVYGIKEDMKNTTFYLQKAYDECKIDGETDEEVCYLLMSVYMTADNYQRVIELSEELCAASTNDTYVNIAKFYQAESYRHLNDEDKAKEAYEETIKRCRATALANPAALDAYMIRGLALSKLGNHEKALEMIDYVLTLAPESAEIHAARATVLKELGRTEEMEAEVQKTNELNTKLGTIMSSL